MDILKRRNNYYIPGIISLTILPFLLVYFANKEIKAKTFAVIPIFLADTNLPKEYPEWFTKFREHFPPDRNYVDIDFTGNTQNDKTNLDIAQLRIRKILLQNDSTNGVHFKFSNNSQYGTFVKAIDILRFEGAKTYMPLDHDLWFYHFQTDTSTKQSGIKYCLFNDVMILEPKTSWATIATEWSNKFWLSSWQIILGFSTFLLSILILRQKRKDR